VRLVLPHMRRQGYGRIINIASIRGLEWGGYPAYNAAKAGVISYSKSLARELAPTGITVNTICPGGIEGTWDLDTDPYELARYIREDLPMGRMGRAEEVAAVAVFLASKPASLITGAAVPVDGAQSRSTYY
jgi:3-oxoacyl-[acyl-carrier protein] reductase